ncbi:MAG: AAA family ATPase [Gammaproteobacteria bacterium]|nr:AAA family ATPase [Gammaproteobacteria bacterium]
MQLPFSGRRYYLKFGLERDPFPRDSAEQKVFLTHDMIHCLDQIKAAVDRSDQLVVVASPRGAGKTVLSRYLGFIKSSGWFVGHVPGSRELDREALAYEIIRQHFPERRFARAQAIYLLREFLQLFARNGRTPVVIIDDAHLLQPDTLKFVLEIAGYRQQGAQYRFVLFGDLGIDEKLKDPNLRNLIPARYHHFRIPSLSLQQTRKYLEYRLSLCGELREDPFTDERVQEIFAASAGLPGDIHVPARRIMQEYPIAGSNKQALIQLAATASVCLLVFTAVYSAMNEDYQEKSEQLAVSRTAKVEVIPLNLPGTGTLIKPAPVTQPEITDNSPVASETAALEKTKAAVEKPRPEGLLARVFGSLPKLLTGSGPERHGTYGPGPDKTNTIASLDSQLSLKLSDVINN